MGCASICGRWLRKWTDERACDEKGAREHCNNAPRQSRPCGRLGKSDAYARHSASASAAESLPHSRSNSRRTSASGLRLLSRLSKIDRLLFVTRKKNSRLPSETVAVAITRIANLTSSTVWPACLPFFRKTFLPVGSMRRFWSNRIDTAQRGSLGVGMRGGGGGGAKRRNRERLAADNAVSFVGFRGATSGVRQFDVSGRR